MVERPQHRTAGAVERGERRLGRRDRLDQAQIEARAKVFWGDPAEDVIKYLQMQGISYDDACVMVDSMFAERERAIAGESRSAVSPAEICRRSA